MAKNPLHDPDALQSGARVKIEFQLHQQSEFGFLMYMEICHQKNVLFL